MSPASRDNGRWTKSGWVRRGRTLALLLLLGLGGWWVYTTFLAPPDAVVIRNRVTRDATQQATEHQWEQALATINSGLASLPGDWELLVWQSALLGKLGLPDQDSLAQAEKKASQVDVLIELGTVSTLIEWPEKALLVGEQLVDQVPDMPQGYFLEGQGYELAGQPGKALEAYRAAADHAANNPDYSGILVVARERIAALSVSQP